MSHQRLELTTPSAAERLRSPAGAAATAWCRAKQECGPGRGATPGSAAFTNPGAGKAVRFAACNQDIPVRNTRTSSFLRAVYEQNTWGQMQRKRTIQLASFPTIAPG